MSVKPIWRTNTPASVVNDETAYPPTPTNDPATYTPVRAHTHILPTGEITYSGRQTTLDSVLAINAEDVPVEFLNRLRPGGPWVLTAIDPQSEAIDTITAKDEKAVRAFVANYNGRRNCYFSVNPTRGPMQKKAAKTDIAAIEYLLSDLDPSDDETPEAAKFRYLAKLEALQPAPTMLIDSGNGIQVLFKLAEPIDLLKLPPPVKDKDGKLVLSPEAKKIVDDAENRAKALMERLGSKAGTQNIDRILRLPGTINLPNAKKKRDGRVACPTRLLKASDATCSLEDFATCSLEDFPLEDLPEDGSADNKPEEKQSKRSIDWDKVAEHAGWLKNVSDLPLDFSEKGKLIVGHTGNLQDLNADLQDAALVEKSYGTWNSVTFALAAIFKADKRFTIEQIAAALLCDLHCNQHIRRQKDKNRAVDAQSTIHTSRQLIAAPHCCGGGSARRAALRLAVSITSDWRSPRLASNARSMLFTIARCWAFAAT